MFACHVTTTWTLSVTNLLKSSLQEIPSIYQSTEILPAWLLLRH